jgi:uncharacterized membrane protein YfcA
VELGLFFSLQPWQWALTSVSGFIVGLSKTGLSGLGLIFVPMMALAFGAKASTGVLLPILNMGDVFAVSYYRRHADTKKLFALLPWALVGLGAGVTVGATMPDLAFKRLLGGVVLVLLALMIWQEFRKDQESVPTARWFPVLAGLSAGFTTMIGNAAGPVMSLYLLSMRLPKNAFIGTSAWFFLILNLVKVPLQIVFWHNISMASFVIDLAILPAIALGAWVGLKIVGKIPERVFKILVLVMTGVSALALLAP